MSAATAVRATPAATDGGAVRRAFLRVPDHALRRTVLAALERAGVTVTAAPGPGTVLIAGGPTVEEALTAGQGAVPHGGYGGLLLVADRFDATGTLRALAAGVVTMLPVAGLDRPAELATALRAALDGDPLVPHGVLVRLLEADPAPTPRPDPAAGARPGPRSGRALTTAPLTARQVHVLSLVAEGYDNAAIAGILACSAHTVKNALYDTMARLQVRNRAHAVAHAVREGLI